MSALTESEDRPHESDKVEEVSEFTKLKKAVIAGHRQRGDWRKEARKSFQYKAGHQWSEDDEKLLKDQNRPAVTFNRVAPIIKIVCGLEVNNRQKVVYQPREQGDVGINETITAAADWVRDRCGAEDEESHAFRDMSICGEGWTEMRMDYEEDIEGRVIQERVNPLEMGVGVGAYKQNHEGARMVYRVRDMDVDDARAIMELEDEVLAEAIHVKWLEDFVTPADGGQGNKKDYPDETRSGLTRDGKRPSEVRVVQCQYWERRSVMVVAQEGEELQELSLEEFATFEERVKALNDEGAGLDETPPIEYKSVKVPRKFFYECFLMNDSVVGKRELEFKTFSFCAMTGEYDEEKKCFYGLMRDMFDPQMWANKWLSQSMNILNANAKGGLLAETDAFANVRKAEEDWSDPTKIVWAKPGALGKNKIKERQPFPMPQGLNELMVFAISSIRDVTGVNLELLGQADREQAASLEMQRRQSAMTILATLFDALRRYRKTQGKLTLHFVWLLPDGTLVRIMDQGKQKYIPLVKDKSVEKYDIIIDDAPSSPDQKQFIWAVTREILQMGILPPQVVVRLLKYSPYPESVVNEISEAMGLTGEEPPEQTRQKLQQAEQALQVLEGELQKAIDQAKTAEDKRELEAMKLNIEKYRAMTERMKVTGELEIDEEQLEIDRDQQETQGEA